MSGWVSGSGGWLVSWCAVIVSHVFLLIFHVQEIVTVHQSNSKQHVHQQHVSMAVQLVERLASIQKFVQV